MPTAVYSGSRKTPYNDLFSLEIGTILLAFSEDILKFPTENSKEEPNIFLSVRGDSRIYSLQTLQDKAKA